MPEAARQDELKRAVLAIRALRARIAELEGGATDSAAPPVAVVGMSCRFPGGAHTPERFWALLRDGVDATRPIPEERWDVARFHNPDPEAPGGIYFDRGGFLREPVDRFDPEFFGISPREAISMDPVQRLLLELSWEALEHAAIDPEALEGSRTGVFVGVAGSDYESILTRTESYEGIDIHWGTGTASSVAGGRISHALGLRGANLTVDTACSSSLSALVLAVDQLRSGRCDTALAGGAQLILEPASSVFLCRLRALTPGGRCRTFAASADGYARGEGGALFVLKRLDDARRDGDHIHAVIRGGAVNHDGRSSGLTVPNMGAQREVIRAALDDARLAPTDIDYVEAHGTATPLGDPIELRALGEVFAGRDPDNPLLVGSVKTNIGHTEAAAGAGGLLKAVLMLAHGHRPPHLHFDEPTPHVDWSVLPLRVEANGGPWPSIGRPRRVGVSSFGFSGTNAHVIVEEYRDVAPTEPPARSAEWLPISARTPTALRTLAGQMAAVVREGAPLADLSYTLVAGRSALPFRTSVVATDAADAIRQFESIAAEGGPTPAETRGEPDGGLTFLFTGQGSAWPGMGRELLRSGGPAREMLERCDALLRDHMEGSLLDLLESEDDPEVWQATGLQQPALFSLEMALYALWRSWGLTPSRVAGHSLGEYVAATVAGVMSLDDALPLVALRGRLMQSLPAGGAMMALETDEATARALLGRGVGIASLNGPRATVVSGDAEAVARVGEAARGAGIRATPLRVSHAFHSHRMEPILPAFAEAVAKIELSAPRLPLISNLTGAVMTATEARDPERWVRHLREPVRFGETFETLVEAGARTVLEIGAHPALSAMGAEAVEADVRWLPSLRRRIEAWPVLLSSLAALHHAGFPIDRRAFAKQRGGRPIAAPTYPFERERYWVDLDASPLRPAAESVHPLLGAPLVSPAIEGWVFEQTIGPGAPLWLDDHRVQGRRIVPGAAWIEAALAAAEHGPGWSDATVERLDFVRPLTADEPRTIQTVVRTVAGGQAAVQFFAADRVDGRELAWESVAIAVVREQGDEPPLLERVEAPAVDVDDVSRQLRAWGLEYGPTFRRLAHLAGAGTGFEAGLSPSDSPPGARPHPGVIDTAFQGLTAVPTEVDVETTQLPLRIGGAAFPPGRASVATIVGRVRDGDGPLVSRPADFDFLDADGSRVGWIRGFEVRSLEVHAWDGPGDAWTVDWAAVESPEPPSAVAGRWWVVGARGGIADEVAGALTTAGASLRRTDLPSDDVDLASWAATLTEDPDLAGVVFAVDAPPAAHRAAPAVVESIADRLLAVRALLAAMSPTAPLVLVTRGASGGAGDHGIEGADLPALHAVIRAEHSERACRVVDLDPFRSTPPGLLAGWVLTGGADERVALRDGEALAPRITPLEVDSPTSPRVTGENYRIALGPRGTLDTIRYEAVGRREPDAGEVEVRVEATGLNFRDVLNVLGRYPGDPGLPGVEFAGVVERVGPGVEELAPGDRVMGMHLGMFARWATVPIRTVVRAPAALDLAEAAAIPVAFLTAVWALEHVARLQPGERVLIHAGTGGVGQAAIQVARAAGAEIFTTAGSEWKRQLLRDQGIEHIFDSRTPSFHDGVLAATGGEGVDVVLNALTGELLQRSLDLLGEGGRFVELGKAEVLDPDEVRASRGVAYTAFELGTIPLDDAEYRAFVNSVAERFERGDFTPPTVRTFAADEIRDAFRYMAQARHVGKLVVLAGRPRVAPPIRGDGLYLVTGATGGVGRTVIDWLAAEGAGAIVATARSRPSPEVQERFDALTDAGCPVHFVSADVGTDDGVATLAEACSAHPLDLAGVIHVAGALDDRALADVDRESVRRVAGAKVGGAIRLDAAFPDVETFVLFGSIAGVMAGPGQATYAAANGVLGAIAAARRREGKVALCVDWGAWAGGGMTARLDDSARRMLARRGVGLLAPDEACRHLGVLLEAGTGRAIVAEVNWDRVAVSTGGQLPPILERVVDRVEAPRRPRRALDLDVLSHLDADAREAAITEYVQAALGEVLGLDPGRLAPDVQVARLGFDSLMAIELRNRFQTELGLAFQASALLDAVTINDLAALVTLDLAVAETTKSPPEFGDPAELVETFEF